MGKSGNKMDNPCRKDYQLNLDKIKEHERESQTTFNTVTPPKKSKKCSKQNSKSNWKVKHAQLSSVKGLVDGVQGLVEEEEDSFEEKLKETPHKHSTNNKIKGTYEEEMKMKRIEREFKQKMSSIKVDKKMDTLKRKSIEAMSNKYLFVLIPIFISI